MIAWLADLWWRIKDAITEPFDYVDSTPQCQGDSTPPAPDDLSCPDTEPTSPGALDSDF